MALVKLDHVEKIMRDEEVPFWYLTDNGGEKNVISSNQSEENIETSIERLQEILADVEDSVVCISLSNKTRKEKAQGGRGHKQYTFKIKLREKEAVGMMGGNQGMFALVLQQMEKNNELSREILKLQLEKKHDEEIAGLQEKPDSISTIITILDKHADKIFGTRHGIADVGGEDETVDEEKVNAEEKIRAALIKLRAVDKNLPETLTQLAKFATKNPKKYKELLPLLSTL